VEGETRYCGEDFHVPGPGRHFVAGADSISTKRPLVARRRCGIGDDDLKFGVPLLWHSRQSEQVLGGSIPSFFFFLSFVVGNV